MSSAIAMLMDRLGCSVVDDCDSAHDVLGIAPTDLMSNRQPICDLCDSRLATSTAPTCDAVCRMPRMLNDMSIVFGLLMMVTIVRVVMVLRVLTWLSLVCTMLQCGFRCLVQWQRLRLVAPTSVVPIRVEA